ncbi:MAG: DNA cytosine methyltransferase [Gammaproteobacteria bacterium]|nr:DNA cytosine methyltransferase [Gammaproteobacteria bacterium]
MSCRPPCQGHSDLNNVTRRNDPRNSLYMACIRAVELMEPDFIIIENVPTVIHSTEGVVQNTSEKLREMGYFVRNLNINFLDLGLPPIRKRHVLTASKDKGLICSFVVPPSRRQKATLREFISKLSVNGNELMSLPGKLSDTNLQRVDYLFDKELYDLPNELRPSCHKNKLHSYKSVYGRLNYDFPAQTITSGYGSMGQGRYIHPSERRTINSYEASRIQGFPASFDFSKAAKLTELRQMIANAVPPQLTYLLASYYLKNRFNVQIAF